MSHRLMQIKLIDCTLRDGGYYNDWYFPDTIAKKHVECAIASKIDYLEIGFRFLEQKKLGPYAKISNKKIQQILSGADQKICIMVNGSDLLKCVNSGQPITNLLPGSDIDKSISLLRVAVHYDELTYLLNIFSELIALGYNLAINLMQISIRNNDEILEFVKFCNNLKVEICYFADSLGSLQLPQTKSISRIVRENFQGGDVGYHSHDNNGLAFENCIAAVENGVTIMDGSITGMGRGAGNVSLEDLLIEFRSPAVHKHKGYVKLIKEFYHELKLDKHWGTNVYYHYASNLKIHPTYCQNLLKIPNLSSVQIMNALQQLSKVNDPARYVIAVERDIIRDIK